MSFFDEFKNSAAKTLKKMGEYAGEIKDRAALEIQIHKVQKQIDQAKESTRSAHEAMGRRVYELFKAGQITDEKLTVGCREVETLAQKMDELATQIVQLREDFDKQEAPPEEPTDPPPPTT